MQDQGLLLPLQLGVLSLFIALFAVALLAVILPVMFLAEAAIKSMFASL